MYNQRMMIDKRMIVSLPDEKECKKNIAKAVCEFFERWAIVYQNYKLEMELKLPLLVA